MLECCTSGSCAGLGSLYILTVVVVMIDDSNTRRYKLTSDFTDISMLSSDNV